MGLRARVAAFNALGRPRATRVGAFQVRRRLSGLSCRMRARFAGRAESTTPAGATLQNVDTGADESAMATVPVGLPTRRHLVFVLLAGAVVGPGYVKVDYERSLVKSARRSGRTTSCPPRARRRSSRNTACPMSPA
ncbi:hypothetical protein GCM10010493_39580 [Streptomyces lavendulae subsp. grasserius]